MLYTTKESLCFGEAHRGRKKGEGKTMKERIIQFGEGGFLRGFVDYFFHKMNEQGVFDGSVVVVQPIEKGTCHLLAAQDCRYNLFLRGIDKGRIVEEHTRVEVISRCINPYTAFEDYLALAENPDFRFIVSNTTEAGIAFVSADRLEDRPASSFPGKLTQLLYARYKKGLGGFILLPCELIDHNGEALLESCLRYADHWRLEEGFKTWLREENNFCSTLVDRIVTGFPADEKEMLWEKLGEKDELLDTAEIFHLWVIEGDHEDELPLQKAGFNVVWTKDARPYKRRKVRILNGAHTALVLGARLYGLETVRECLEEDRTAAFLRCCIFEEIIPSLGGSPEDIAFGEAVLERFANPFIRHLLLSIALNSVSKFSVRVLPSILEYKEKFGQYPRGLLLSLAALIAFYKGEEANDGAAVMEFMKRASVEEILEKKEYWGTSLAKLLEPVREYYQIIEKEGMKEAYDKILSE